jgi:hypothetical protein
MRCQLFLIPICLLLLFGCNNEDAAPPRQGTPGRVYVDYKIWGEEANEWVTCMLQFHEESKDGPALLLEAPSRVMLDGEELVPDSARLTGVFYEAQIPLAEFAGEHTLTFTDASGREHKETFVFEPLKVTTNLSGKVKRSNLVLELEGVQPGEKVRVSLMDTAFATADINQLFTPDEGRLVLSREQLKNIASGPVTLFIYKEEERPLKNATPAGGNLSITYELNREFDLVD